MRIFLGSDSGGPMREVAQLPEDAGSDEWTWVHLSVDEREAIERLATTHRWHPIAIEDVYDDYPVSALSDFGDHVFLVLQSIGPASPRVTTTELDGFLDTRSLVTIHHGEIPTVDALIEVAIRQPSMATGGPDLMLARVAAAVTSPYLGVIDRLEERIDSIEDRAIARDPSVITEVQALRSDATRLRKLVAPQRDVLLDLSRDAAPDLVGPAARKRFADGYEQVFRTIESLDGARLLLMAALDTYRSAVAEDMNRVMKVLTAFSAIILPLTLLTGIWGMNFTHMPEIDEPWGYAAALIAMVLVGLAMWAAFVRLGIIGQPRLRDVPRSIGLGLAEAARFPVRGFEAVVRSHADRHNDEIEA